ncbi:MAG: hypothetical protein IKP62_07070 [Salinivirgaceae bacterium]|nr:hypothetical protein [Salinivirgaceae bacterium]MBR6082669.1 hypothetical protein [Salinivirgaceae bacterium]MBR6309842.1 hypothetical protein [Paludibacteraceae bacterium]
MIGSVIEEGSYVRAYDERGNQLCSKYINRPNDRLMGYTGTSFSVKEGSYVRVYDEKGNQLSSKYVG